MKVVALAGGVGGAKLAHGLAQHLSPGDLTVVVNTGDDFEHLGLSISPDLDTVCYTLAGLANPDTGWGRMDETWHAFENIARLGGPDWFRLGDQDLATHLERTRRLKAGQSLSEITLEFCRAWGIAHSILPMTNQPVATIVNTDEGELGFQDYFVQRACEPRVTGFRFAGIDSSEPTPGVTTAIEAAEAVVICPSNPWVSIDPILAVPGMRAGLTKKSIVAVSPIIGGKTIKGPAAKMYQELGIDPSALAAAKHYHGLLKAFVLDNVDVKLDGAVRALGLEVLVTHTLMQTVADRARLAEDVLNFIGKLK